MSRCQSVLLRLDIHQRKLEMFRMFQCQLNIIFFIAFTVTEVLVQIWNVPNIQISTSNISKGFQVSNGFPDLLRHAVRFLESFKIRFVIRFGSLKILRSGPIFFDSNKTSCKIRSNPNTNSSCLFALKYFSPLSSPDSAYFCPI